MYRQELKETRMRSRGSGLLLIAFFAKAQENSKKCATTQMMQWETQENPQYKNTVDNYFVGIKQWMEKNPTS